MLMSVHIRMLMMLLCEAVVTNSPLSLRLFSDRTVHAVEPNIIPAADAGVPLIIASINIVQHSQRS